MKRSDRKKRNKRKVAIIGIILGVTVLFAFFKVLGNNRKNQAVANHDIKVERRDITATITGTAVVEPKDSYSVMSLVNGEVLEAEFEEGDTVEEDTVLYRIDAKDIENSIKSAELAVLKAEQGYYDAIKAKEKNSKTNEKNLQSAALSVEKANQGYNDAVAAKEQTDITNRQGLASAELSVERARSSYDNAAEAVEDLKIESDISGVVAEMYVGVGDNVVVGTNIARVYDNSKLEIKIPFNEDDALKIYTGERADITVSGTGETLFGTVTSVDNASVIKDGYMRVRYVDVRVDSPGALSPDDSAIVKIGSIYCNDEGNFKYIEDRNVYSNVSGTVTNIRIKEGNMVSAGDVIVELESENIIDQKKQAQLAMKEADLSVKKAQSNIENSTGDSQVKNAELSVKDARIAYEKAMENMDDYSSDSQVKNAKNLWEDALVNLEKIKDTKDDYEILAPISGQIITKNIKVGDKVELSTMQEPMAVIYDMSELTFDIMIDELDINKVSLGQPVKITADALDGKEYKGEISKISIDAVQANGVTSYPVTVVITDFDENLLPGMNVDVEIEIERAEDVLAIPKNSVTRDNVVYVKGDKKDSNDKAPEGYRSVNVTIGINDGTYVEIKSGLKAGDMVKATEQTQSMMPFGMMGGPMAGGGAQRSAPDSSVAAGGGKR